ncbi:hypothetical protein HY379_01120 [Candidatus Saccharibacteria bacterium]|nr:hypothetical protein [Candidatus Saccharibacteria bacterium]
METAAWVLLIIVSAILTVFLLLLSISLIFFIRLMRKADNVADSFESAATAFRRSASLMPWAKLIAKVIARKRNRKG